MVVIAAVLMFYVAPKHGKKNILVYVAICSVTGSLTVMACKGIGIALKQTMSGDSNELTNPLAWMLVVGGVLCIMVQMNFLNKALDVFNTSVVTPIYYVMFTTCTIIASAILYKEWAELNAKDSLGLICGFLTIICGVFLLHAFKDIKFSIRDLYGSVSSSSANGVADGEVRVLMSNVMGDGDDDVIDSDEVYLSESNNHNNVLHSNF